MNWRPRDVLNLIALVGAFVLFLVGSFMVYQGVSAEGTNDIKSTLLSGSLKTGSAGLFIVFLAFFLAAFALFSINQTDKPPSSKGPATPSRSSRLANGFFALVGGCAVATTLAAFGFGKEFGLLAGVLGFFAALAGLGVLTFIEHE